MPDRAAAQEAPGEGGASMPGSDSAFEPISEAKRLLRTIRAGSLATLDGSGEPFASLVAVATDFDGSPLILVSQLSAHTRHLDKDPRVSLLLAQTGEGDPLAHPRVTLTATAAKVVAKDERAVVRARYLARHPRAELYADFSDFSFWRLSMIAVHLNGGFARAARFPASRLLTSLQDAETLIAAEQGAVAHMNADHADALALYAEVLAGQGKGAWVATGLDPDGMDLACGDLTARLAFAERITTPGDLRMVLVRLAAEARAAGGGRQGAAF